MELTVTLTIPPIALLDLGRARSILQQELGTAGRVLMESVAAQARLRVPVDRGILRASITVPPTVYGRGHTWLTVTATTGPQAPYAGDIERGTRPHWISGEEFEGLKGWARRTLGDARLAYPVRYAIAKRGTAAQPYMAPAAAQVAPQAPIRLAAALALAAARLTQ